MKPRFRAEWVVVREELLILASCLLRPMSRNSVLEEFRVRRFAVIQLSVVNIENAVPEIMLADRETHRQILSPQNFSPLPLPVSPSSE